MAIGDGIPDFPDSTDFNPLSADTDEDGILDAVEADADPTCWPDPRSAPAGGTRRCVWADDARDDDGLIDGREDTDLNGQPGQGELDLDSADTDMDCLLDGLELGLLAPMGRNTAGSFIPDADGGQFVTRPRLLDSDGDGLGWPVGCDRHRPERADPV